MTDYVTVGVESAYGTAQETRTGILVGNITENVDRGIMIDKTINNTIPQYAVAGAAKVDGTIETNLRAVQAVPLFTSLLGTPTGTTTKVFTVDALKSLTLGLGQKIGDTSVVKVYTGCIIKNCELSFEPKDFVKARFDYIGRAYSEAATGYSAPEYTDELPLVCQTASVTFGSTPSTNIKSATVTINPNVDEDNYVVGSHLLKAAKNTDTYEITGSLTFTEDEYNNFRLAMYGAVTATGNIATSNATGSAVLTFSAANTGGSSFELELDNVVFNNANKTSAPKTEVEKTVEFTATTGATLTIVEASP